MSAQTLAGEFLRILQADAENFPPNEIYLSLDEDERLKPHDEEGDEAFRPVSLTVGVSVQPLDDAGQLFSYRLTLTIMSHGYDVTAVEHGQWVETVRCVFFGPGAKAAIATAMDDGGLFELRGYDRGNSDQLDPSIDSGQLVTAFTIRGMALLV